MKGVFSLKGVVKHYDWGGFSFIPALLKQDNGEKKPFAEYWMGTHPLGMAEIEFEKGAKGGLDALAGQLPYLLKVLDVKNMLSIQVHPSKKDAEREFARENEAGIPVTAAHRNYKDANHKPEMMVALTDFWLLHGFRLEAELEQVLRTVPEFSGLLPVYLEGGYAALYKTVMEMPAEEVFRTLDPLLKRIIPAYEEGRLDKSGADFWAARAALTYNHDEHADRGIFSIYFFNIVALKKGEGIFQDAGLPHAYLEGVNVELMASSDNVLRGGLTPKHIDVPELLKHVQCSATIPRILRPEPAGESELLFDTPVTDFRLSMFELKAGETVSFTPDGVEILLLTQGMAELDTEDNLVRLETGNPAAIAFPGETVYLAAARDSVVFRAGNGFPQS